MNQDINQILTRSVSEILPSKDTLADLMSQRKIKLYFGIDPTGDLLHLGHSIALRKLQEFADAGHEAILLIGNGTVKIGDPTGKDASRPMLSLEDIEKNWQNWKSQASKILDFEKITVVRNDEWLSQLKFDEIIKLMAKTTVQQLLERDMFQERIKNGSPIHGHEIIYPLLQGYDSVHLDVDLELGGNDQTFNMMMGRTLLKSYKNKEKWILTTPIINGTDGRKMGKSNNNYIALTENHLDMYGKLMSISDSEIINYFELLTNVDSTEISKIKQAIDDGENPMQFKKRLAFEITKMYHDEKLAREAEENFSKTVQQGLLPEDVEEINITNETTWLEIAKACLTTESNGALRRLFEQNAVELEGERITDSNEQAKFNNGQVLKIGKRKYYKLIRH